MSEPATSQVTEATPSVDGSALTARFQRKRWSPTRKSIKDAFIENIHFLPKMVIAISVAAIVFLAFLVGRYVYLISSDQGKIEQVLVQTMTHGSALLAGWFVKKKPKGQ